MVWHGRLGVSNHRPVDRLFNRLQRGVLGQHCWPFVTEIHRSLVDSPHKGPVMPRALPWHYIFVDKRISCCLHRLLWRQSCHLDKISVSANKIFFTDEFTHLAYWNLTYRRKHIKRNLTHWNVNIMAKICSQNFQLYCLDRFFYSDSNLSEVHYGDVTMGAIAS